ncbi:hypothetical protein CKAH01_11679 [Colletotrichum kahawae]|uniref:Uncharacterized protein n=1 Tax=Colletotrichum kahawae TaxID=34407 RepID=A0AAE0DG49_COLKA|nr:hypothetical protein CKAH01_11679 [Colletotrichum kahawae]
MKAVLFCYSLGPDPDRSTSSPVVLRADAQPRCNAPLRRHGGVRTKWHCFC